MQGRNYLSPKPATDLVRALRAAAAHTDDATELSEQELVVLKRIAQGASYKDIAAELEICVKTVDTYRSRLTRKLSLSSREDIVRYAIRQGLVRMDPA
jgi:DNA-binding NarL/FixJ family response regulator